MAILKMFRGRRVRQTKRRGELILVKLARRTANEMPEWIAVTPEEYSREVIQYFTHPPREPSEGPTNVQ